MVVFHSYVSLPEGKPIQSQKRRKIPAGMARIRPERKSSSWLRWLSCGRKPGIPGEILFYI